MELGVEAGVIKVSESGVARVKHAGLASHLLRRLPLFEAAPVDEILDIRRELERPLVRFRGAAARFDDGMRAAGREAEEFVGDAEEVFVQEVEPAVSEIEEAVRDNRFLARLVPGMTEPPHWAAGGALGMAAYNLASLPELASLAVGGGIGLAVGARRAYLDWRESQREVEKKELFFYYEAGQRLAGGGSIVNINSTAGLGVAAGLAAYGASKWGIRGLTKIAAKELARYNIRVNGVHPGIIETPLAYDPATGKLIVGVDDFVIPRLADVDEISPYVLFAASDDALFSTGVELVADGGMMLGALEPAASDMSA